MNVSINFNGKSGAIDKEGEDTSFVSDAGTSPSSLEISVTDSDNNESGADTASSESENLDIGGPPEWLVQAMTSSEATQEDVSDNSFTDDDIDDGGSGPSE